MAVLAGQAEVAVLECGPMASAIAGGKGNIGKYGPVVSAITSSTGNIGRCEPML